MTLPDPIEEPTIDLKRAAVLLGCSYWLACQHADEIPGVFRIGRRIRVKTAVLLDSLGLSAAADLSPTQKGASQGSEP